MKEIKINMVDWYPDFEPDTDLTIQILKKKYKVIFSDTPDYVFGSVYGKIPGKYALKSNAIRIFWTGEAVAPNFNIYDYAIGFDDIQFKDRYFRMPLCCGVYDERRAKLIEEKRTFSKKDLERKDLFANFIYSNSGAHKDREVFFRKLCEYKNVSSAGGFLNNMDGFRCKDKIDFQSRCKFSIAFENSVYDGYSTEKIMDAFAAKTIPIYYGNPNVASDFNEDSFINCHNYTSFDEVIKEVKRLDNDAEAYINMMRKNPLAYSFNDKKDDYANFLYNIFDQDIDKAYRRNKSLWGGWIEEIEKKKNQCYSISRLYSNRFTNGIKTVIKK